MTIKTFEYQSNLPRLPIPELADTLSKWIKTCEPFATENDIKELKDIAKDFEDGLGPVLQSRLQAYEKTQTNSWLEAWWLQMAYLNWRDSLLINSNWHIITRNHPNTPKEVEEFCGFISLIPGVGYTKFQIERAAGWVFTL